jgi:hypothetical protein
MNRAPTTTIVRTSARSRMLALAMVVFVCCCAVNAQSPTRAQLEATFLFKFIQYVDWPAKSFPKADSPYIIGILGNDPVAAAVDQTIAGEQFKGRKIETKHFANPSQVTRCHILFITSTEAARLPAVLDKLKGRSILTVSDSADFAQRGGMIGFFDQERKIRFQINNDVAQAAGLSISSKLLQLAQIVHTNERR